MRAPDARRGARIGRPLTLLAGGLHYALSRSNVEGTVVRAFDWDQAACRVYAANHGLGVVRKVAVASSFSVPSVARASRFTHPISVFYRPTLHHSLQRILRSSTHPCGSCHRHASRTQSSIRSRRAQKTPARGRSSASWRTCSRNSSSSASTRATCSWRTSPDSRCARRSRLSGAPAPAPGGSSVLIDFASVAARQTSSTRLRLLATLRALGYAVVELLITPLQFGIPNSRLRYYLLAKARPLEFVGVSGQEDRIWRHIPGHGTDWEDPRTQSEEDTVEAAVVELRNYLDEDTGTSPPPHAIPERILEKWGRLFDIVLPSARRTCCFTRGKCIFRTPPIFM